MIEPCGDLRFVSSFRQHDGQNQHGQWQADRNDESECDHCSRPVPGVAAGSLGYVRVPVMRSVT